eukprot:GDKJ01039547.1.p1 GENE.GDKJ01039547.1~~GDKJ01039547.1.p1  ORF type:complete len:104 (-),score=15.89 GDKJ01039547.1:19-330(-)
MCTFRPSATIPFLSAYLCSSVRKNPSREALEPLDAAEVVEPIFLESEALASNPPVADIFNVLMISFDRSRSAFNRSKISAFLAFSSSLNLFRCTRCLISRSSC